MEGLGETAKCKNWGLTIGEECYTRVCWVDDNILIARGWTELRSLCRHFDGIMPKAGMGADRGDSDECGWITNETRSPEGLPIGEACVQKQQDRVHSTWKAFWANRAA